MNKLHLSPIRKIYSVKAILIMLLFLSTNAAYSLNKLVSNTCLSASPEWIFKNNITSNDIQKEGFWLLEAGTESDAILTPTIDAGNYTDLNLAFNVATFDNGGNNPVKVTFSIDGGKTWASTSFTSTTPTSSEYIFSGDINLGTINSRQLVLMFSNNGNSGRGTRIKDIILTGTPIITTPTAKTATNITSQSFEANWTNIPGATGYLLNVYKTTNILAENFSIIAASSSFITSGSGASGNLNLISSEWTATNGASAGGIVKLGTGSSLGRLNSPTLNLSGKFALTFKSCAWSGDSKTIDILLNGTLLQTITLDNNILSASEIKEYTIRGEGTGNDIISFSARNTSDNRFFIDDVCIQKLEEIPDSPFTILSGETTNKTITPLSLGTYYYTVKATNNIYTSEESNIASAVVTTTSEATSTNQEKKKLSVYTSQKLIVINYANHANTIEIYSPTGKLIRKIKTPPTQMYIPVPSGINIVKTESDVIKVIVK